MLLFWVGTQTTLYLLSFLDLDLYSMINRWGGRLGYYTCYFDPLRSLGKSPLWWTSSITKTREVPTKVTVVGSSIVTQDLGTCGGALHKYKSCDNIFGVVAGEDRVILLNDTSLVRFLWKPLSYNFT